MTPLPPATVAAIRKQSRTRAAVIRGLRIALGLTQVQAAVACDVTPTTWISLEHDGYNPSESTLQAVADLFVGGRIGALYPL